MQTEEYTLAKIAYDAYCADTNWKSAISGADLPPFSGLTDPVVQAWIASARAVKRYVDANS